MDGEVRLGIADWLAGGHPHNGIGWIKMHLSNLPANRSFKSTVRRSGVVPDAGPNRSGASFSDIFT